MFRVVQIDISEAENTSFSASGARSQPGSQSEPCEGWLCSEIDKANEYRRTSFLFKVLQGETPLPRASVLQ